MKYNYGKERNLGDIIYNKKDRSIFCNLKVGFFNETIGLVQRTDGCYDLTKNIGTGEDPNIIKIGQTFPVKKKNGTIVEGLTQTQLPLVSNWDKEAKKVTNSREDNLSITTHKIKERKNLKNDFIKVGYITGRFVIEVDKQVQNKNIPDIPPEIDVNEDEIPF